MRIISGIAGGVRLEAPEGQGVRPTEDRVKESIFSTLGDLSGKRVLDLFAGTGALGLEALSRGAEAVYGFEKDAAHCAVIRRNIAAVERAMQAPGNYRLFNENAQGAVARLGACQADVILADPPYETAPGEYGWRELMLDGQLAAKVAPGGLLVLEHGSDKELPWYPESPWKPLRTRVFGIRAVSYARLALEEKDV